jgi:hypothetical protein
VTSYPYRGIGVAQDTTPSFQIIISSVFMIVFSCHSTLCSLSWTYESNTQDSYAESFKFSYAENQRDRSLYRSRNGARIALSFTSTPLRRPVHSQLNWANLLCNVIPDGKTE